MKEYACPRGSTAGLSVPAAVAAHWLPTARARVTAQEPKLGWRGEGVFFTDARFLLPGLHTRRAEPPEPAHPGRRRAGPGTPAAVPPV